MARLETPARRDLITLSMMEEKSRRRTKGSHQVGFTGNYNDGADQEEEGRTPEDPPISTSVPSSGPPRSWIDTHGVTPGCYAYDGILSKGTARGRVHSHACKNRYKVWLEHQTENQRKRRRTEEEDPRLSPAPAPLPQIKAKLHGCK